MKKNTPVNWIFVSLAGIVLFIVLLFLIINYSDKIKISVPLYFFLVVFIALISSALLSGALKSVARYNSSINNKTLYISGPAVIFFIILYVAYKYKPSDSHESLSLSILFNGPGKSNELINDGNVSIRIAQYASIKKINEEGTVVFTGINPEYKGKEIDFSISIPGYYLKTDTSYTLDQEESFTNLHLYLNRTLETTKVKGRLIKLPAREGIAGALIEFSGIDTLIKTDATGAFAVTLPIKSGTETRIIVTKANKELYNSLRTIVNNDYLSIGTE